MTYRFKKIQKNHCQILSTSANIDSEKSNPFGSGHESGPWPWLTGVYYFYTIFLFNLFLKISKFGVKNKILGIKKSV